MRRQFHDDGWRWRFAIIPFCLSDGPNKTWVWFEWYRARFAGLYTEVELVDATTIDKGREITPNQPTS